MEPAKNYRLRETKQGKTTLYDLEPEEESLLEPEIKKRNNRMKEELERVFSYIKLGAGYKFKSLIGDEQIRRLELITNNAWDKITHNFSYTNEEYCMLRKAIEQLVEKTYTPWMMQKTRDRFLEQREKRRENRKIIHA